MPFTTGDPVHIATLGTGVVREVRNRRRYVVEIKGQSFVVSESQIRAADRKTRSPARSGAEPLATANPASHRGSPTQIDLHGMTTGEAVAALDSFLNDAILAGHEQVRIIHGRSGGRVKAAVHARLREIRAVRRYRVDATNAGVTIVEF